METGPTSIGEAARRCGGADLVARGFETIADLPPGGLTAIQERQRLAVTAGRVVVEPGLARALRVFREPLAFLDFETVMLAIPVWDGCHPYDQVPVQFSCDRSGPDGTIAHHEWLADGPGDPRPELARSLVAACRGARTVVAYNAQFERRCIVMLADAVPDLADDLLDIADRLADPLPIIREHVYHPAFHGSFSLKSVLPALAPPDPVVIARSPAKPGDVAISSSSPPAIVGPWLAPALESPASSHVGAGLAPALESPVIARSQAQPGDAAISSSPQGSPNLASDTGRPSRSSSPYATLEIAEGATASVELERLMFRSDGMTADKKQHLRDALLFYCALDTMSMVRLLDSLRELS